MKTRLDEMVGSLVKGIEKIELHRPPSDTFKEHDLSSVPRFISYKAAMLKENLNLKYAVVVISLFSTIAIGVLLHKNLQLIDIASNTRYMLVPSRINGITPAQAMEVDKTYIRAAVNDFVRLLTNFGPEDIEDSYVELASYMEDYLKAQFLAESIDFREQVRKDKIYERFRKKPILVTEEENGLFRVEVDGERDRFLGTEFIGSTKETISLTLRTVAPQGAKEWTLQIQGLKRTSH